MHDDFDGFVATIKDKVEIPVVLFPGGSGQISAYADAVLFMSLLSGRNPQYLIGEQVKAAPVVKKLGLESIPTGYLLIESGSTTSAQFVSDTHPIPRDKTQIAVAHAMAAELLGMKLVYLEAGSGASNPVPPEMIAAIVGGVNIPVIVGGGIRNKDDALAAAQAGATAIIVGNAIEEQGDEIIDEMTAALKTIKV